MYVKIYILRSVKLLTWRYLIIHPIMASTDVLAGFDDLCKTLRSN